MTNYMALGPTPCMEDCVQIGTPDYHEKATKECQAFRNQLVRVFGEPPGAARFVIKSFPHDFGNYLEVCVVYNPDDDKESKFAYKVEGESPKNWDEEARKELGLS